MLFREVDRALNLQISLTERTEAIYNDFMASSELGDKIGFDVMYELLGDARAYHRVADQLTTYARKNDL